jgi:hypothetical protein
MKNKISTLGYFKKRLKDNGFIVLDLFKNYSEQDQRRWTVMVNPNQESLIITCKREPDFDSPIFEFNDINHKIPVKIATSSMEVIIDKLLNTFKINNYNKTSPYYKDRT